MISIKIDQASQTLGLHCQFPSLADRSTFDVDLLKLFTPLSIPLSSIFLECESHNNKLCHYDFPPTESLTEKLDFMLNPDNVAKREQDMERARQSARDD